jgi:hypothetical protein
MKAVNLMRAQMVGYVVLGLLALTLLSGAFSLAASAVEAQPGVAIACTGTGSNNSCGG